MTAIVDFSGPAVGKVHITHPDRSLLMQEIEDIWRGQTGFALATLNLDHIVKLRKDPDLRTAYLAQTHVVADGNPIVWLSRQAGRQIDLIPGSELVVPLAQLAARVGVPIALLGATKETLEAAAQELCAQFPGLTVACKIAPPFGFDPASDAAAAILEDINASGARLCFLALGSPKQERLAARGRALAPGCGFVSIGAGLDFIAGSQKRAPRWVQRLALEWVWRMLGNPRRLAGRYMACIAIMPGLVLSASKSKRRKAS